MMWVKPTISLFTHRARLMPRITPTYYVSELLGPLVLGANRPTLTPKASLKSMYVPPSHLFIDTLFKIVVKKLRQMSISPKITPHALTSVH